MQVACKLIGRTDRAPTTHLNLRDHGLRRKRSDLDGLVGKTGDVPAVGADEVRMLGVRRPLGARKLVPPDGAELRLREDACFRERDEASENRSAIHAVAGEPVGELGMAYGHAKPGELSKHAEALIRNPDPVSPKQLLQPPVALGTHRSHRA